VDGAPAVADFSLNLEKIRMVQWNMSIYCLGLYPVWKNNHTFTQPDNS